MVKLKEAIVLISVLLFILIQFMQSTSAISNVEHYVEGDTVILFYQGTPPFWINIRQDTNIGQAGGYLWAKTYSNSFTYDMSFAINPSKTFYYGVKDSSWSTLGTFALNRAELVLDQETGIYLEAIAYNEISNIRNSAKVCQDCNNLPQPTVAIGDGNLPSEWNLYLNNKKVTRFSLPAVPEVEAKIVDNPQNVLSKPYGLIEADGTNSIKFLIPSGGNYFSNRYDMLNPNQKTDIKYQVVKKQGQYGSAYFFVLENDHYLDLDNIILLFDKIAKSNSNLANLNAVDPYYVIAVPPEFTTDLGAEGNTYMNNHLMTINYGGEKYYTLYNPGVFGAEMSHEYAHGLQDTQSLWQKYPNGAFFSEGIADAVSIFNGYRKWEDVGLGGNIEPGCAYLPNPDDDHTMGRCVFKHLDQKGYLNSALFNRMFHPTKVFDLISCTPVSASTGERVLDISLQNTDCVTELNRLLSYLTNQDMTSFMKNELLANI